jgi:superfamily II DNA helicase RecQ
VPLVAAVGARFEHGGYEHEVVEIHPGAVRTAIVGGTARTTVPLGTVVRVGSARATLVHAGADAAFERLRTWRSTKAAGKPAYTVFADATLRDLANMLPATEAELARVKGVGPTKLQLYGDELLGLLDELR